MIRETLFLCVYGAYHVEQVLEQHQGRFWHKPISEGRQPSLASALDSDDTVWLPRTLRQELATLAHAAGMTYSNYVRALLILHFMGRRSTPDRDVALQAASEQREDK